MAPPPLSPLTRRHCVRAFLDRPVEPDVLREVLTAAAHAPSTRNTQPWRVAVVTGRARDELSRRLCAAHDAGVPVSPDYPNRIAEPDDLLRRRAAEFGRGVYDAGNVDRADAEARRLHIRANHEFFGAPVEMIFHLPGGAVPGTFLEMGLFLQNVMTGLTAVGLGSCPQYSVAGYADLIRDQLGLRDAVIVCGLAVGHPDPDAPVNAFRPGRAPLREYVDWHR
ncbi:nitroreductase [Saccharothrix australiensis]|uniref:nitroreductase n=1 Tax=Saccharothrix australiensis TaxID=2072 RepID=UPI001476F7C8|nr:nitroreductase [Saccharothrix australiensis]